MRCFLKAEDHTDIRADRNGQKETVVIGGKPPKASSSRQSRREWRDELTASSSSGGVEVSQAFPRVTERSPLPLLFFDEKKKQDEKHVLILPRTGEGEKKNTKQSKLIASTGRTDRNFIGKSKANLAARQFSFGQRPYVRPKSNSIQWMCADKIVSLCDNWSSTATECASSLFTAFFLSAHLQRSMD